MELRRPLWEVYFFRLCAPTSGRSGFGTPFLSFCLRRKVPKPPPRKSLKPRSSIGVLQKPLFHIRAPDPLFALRAPSFRIAARQGDSKKVPQNSAQAQSSIGVLQIAFRSGERFRSEIAAAWKRARFCLRFASKTDPKKIMKIDKTSIQNGVSSSERFF